MRKLHGIVSLWKTNLVLEETEKKLQELLLKVEKESDKKGLRNCKKTKYMGVSKRNSLKCKPLSGDARSKLKNLNIGEVF